MPDPARSQYRFGDVLALARKSWIQQLREQVLAAGYSEYRRSDAWITRVLLQSPRPIGKLGAEVGVTRQAARQLADGLLERGFATFELDPTDARRKLVALTPDGRQYARAVAKATDLLNHAILDRVSARDMQRADAVLRAVFPDEMRERLSNWMPPPKQ